MKSFARIHKLSDDDLKSLNYQGCGLSSINQNGRYLKVKETLCMYCVFFSL